MDRLKQIFQYHRSSYSQQITKKSEEKLDNSNSKRKQERIKVSTYKANLGHLSTISDNKIYGVINDSIAVVDMKTGISSILAGANSSGYEDGQRAKFNYPSEVAIDTLKKVLYVSDTDNHVIRVVNLKDRSVSTLCGTPKYPGYADGIGTKAKFDTPVGLAFDSTNRVLLVADVGNYVIRQIHVDEGRAETLAGTPRVHGNEDSTLSGSKFTKLHYLCLNSSTRELYASDCNSMIRKISLDSSRVTTIPETTFYSIHGLAIDEKNNCLFVSGCTEVIIKLQMSGVTFVASKLCGQSGNCGTTDGNEYQTRFNIPQEILYDSDYSTLLVLDTRGIRRISMRTILKD